MYAQLGHTLQAIKSRAVFQRRDISATPMADVLRHMKRPVFSGAENIEETAVSFYLSNHGFHLIESAVQATALMPDAMAALAEQHVRSTSAMSLRMFHYLITICAEEMPLGAARNEGLFDFVESTTSADASKWLRQLLSGGGGHGWRGALTPKAVGSATLWECCKALEMGFRFGQWSYGCGGLPWAQIAEVATEVVKGSNSLELMVDKAFTLCHNNGAIFNKGHQFTTYRSDFYAILDIQASGQMPAAVHSRVGVNGFCSPSVMRLHKSFAEIFPAEFHLPYDPSKVKSMEAVRMQKTAALAQKAKAFLGAGGGWGGGGALAPAGPPKRPCDDLFTLEDIASLTGTKVR